MVVKYVSPQVGKMQVIQYFQPVCGAQSKMLADIGWPQFLTRKLRWERTLAMMWEGRHLANATLASLDVSGLVISLERSVRTMRKVVLSRVLWAMVIQKEWDKVSEKESAEGGLQRQWLRRG